MLRKNILKKIAKKLLAKLYPDCSICDQFISEYDLISTSKKDDSFILCFRCAKIYKESYPHYLELKSIDVLKETLIFHKALCETAYKNLEIAQGAYKIASCQVAAIKLLIAEKTP